MAGSYENREHERCSCVAPVILYDKENTTDYFYGHIYDHSHGGMYIKTDADLKGNHTYLVRISNNGTDSTGPEKYKDYYGIIRWARFVDESEYADSKYKYGYGMEYSEPTPSI